MRPFEVLPGVCLTVWNVPPGVRYSLDYARKDRSCTVSFFRTGSAVLDMADGQTTHLGPGDVLVASAKNIVFAAQAPAQCHGVTIDLDPVRIEDSVRQDAAGLDLSRLAGFVCFVKQIFRKSSSNSFGSQHESFSDFTKGCGTYPSFLFPSMSESVTRRLSPLNSTSLPWCTILSTSADASLSSANTVPHFPNSMLVVSTIDWRS